MPTLTAPAYADIEAAAAMLAGVVVETPCVESNALSEITGTHVTLKCENLQRTGSFKTRGSYVKLQSLTREERARGVVAVSAGNHAQGVAYHGARLGIATTIVMPKTTPYSKIRRTETLGGRVVLRGANLAEAALDAQTLAVDEGLTMIHPYDDPHVIAGQGTVGIEFARACAHLDAVVVPVGGGGLIAGMAIAFKHLAPHVEVIGVQTEEHCSLYQLFYGERPLAHGLPTLAEGIAVKSIGSLNATIARELVDDVLIVGEPALEHAVHLLLEEEKLVVEGAGAAALAAVLRHPHRFARRRVGLVVSGGNIDSGLLASVILRARFAQGRVARVRVQIVDAPGALSEISTLLATHHANVVEVSHHRAFTDVPAKCAELDFTIEMRHPRDIESILNGLRGASYETTVLTGGANDGCW